jgi:hypothetical protein
MFLNLSDAESLDGDRLQSFPPSTKKVADVLEGEIHFVIHDWMGMVEKQEDLMLVSPSFEERTGTCRNCSAM